MRSIITTQQIDRIITARECTTYRPRYFGFSKLLLPEADVAEWKLRVPIGNSSRHSPPLRFWVVVPNKPALDVSRMYHREKLLFFKKRGCWRVVVQDTAVIKCRWRRCILHADPRDLPYLTDHVNIILKKIFGHRAIKRAGCGRIFRPGGGGCDGVGVCIAVHWGIREIQSHIECEITPGANIKFARLQEGGGAEQGTTSGHQNDD